MSPGSMLNKKCTVFYGPSMYVVALPGMDVSNWDIRLYVRCFAHTQARFFTSTSVVMTELQLILMTCSHLVAIACPQPIV